jgi:hypothetical protein
MTGHLLPRCRLFVFVKTHPHLQYYLKLSDTRSAANQDRLLTANVLKIRALDKIRAVDKATRPNV